jgi:hypothetical protein
MIIKQIQVQIEMDLPSVPAFKLYADRALPGGY